MRMRNDYAQWRHHHSTSRFQATVTLVYRVQVVKRMNLEQLWNKFHTICENPYNYYTVINWKYCDACEDHGQWHHHPSIS
jgi:hypothetical protein